MLFNFWKKSPAPNYLIIIGSVGAVLFLLLIILGAYSSNQTNTNNSQRVSDSNLTSVVGAAPEQYLSSPVRGDPSALISIFEFSCFTCPYSALIQDELKAVLDQYPEQVKIIWKDTPLEQTPEAWPAHHAARCAQAQNKFWEYADELWINQDNLSKDTFISIAKKLSLDQPVFEKCLADTAVDTDIRKDLDEATTIGVGGTPTLIIGDEVLSGVYSADQIAAIIESQL